MSTYVEKVVVICEESKSVFSSVSLHALNPWLAYADILLFT